MDYVLNFEYNYKLGDCITFCEYDSCKKLKRKWNTRWAQSSSFLSHLARHRNYIEIRVRQGTDFGT